MRKLALLTGALLVLVLALVSGFSTARPAWAICYCDPNESYSYTNINWGLGTNCTEAQNDLLAETATEAYGYCGGSTKTCLGNLIITTPCGWVWDGHYQVNGYREYKCKVCEPIDREPRVP
ncbi:MAG TPA: hypothetical protein VGG03_27530 [Thermoanaerobaculia bacterium]